MHLGAIPPMPQGTLKGCFPEGDPAFSWISRNLEKRILTTWEPTDEKVESVRYLIDQPVNFDGLVDFIGGKTIARRKSFFPNQIRWIIDRQIRGEEGFLGTDGWPNVFMVSGHLQEDIVLMPLFVSYVSVNAPLGGWSVWTLEPSELSPGSSTVSELMPGKAHIIF